MEDLGKRSSMEDLGKIGDIRHINPLLFDVIDDKPEGVARGVYHV